MGRGRRAGRQTGALEPPGLPPLSCVLFAAGGRGSPTPAPGPPYRGPVRSGPVVAGAVAVSFGKSLLRGGDRDNVGNCEMEKGGGGCGAVRCSAVRCGAVRGSQPRPNPGLRPPAANQNAHRSHESNRNTDEPYNVNNLKNVTDGRKKRRGESD